MTTHLVPPDGDSLTPCCGRSPFDLPPGDRITRDERTLDCSRKWCDRCHSLQDVSLSDPDEGYRLTAPGHLRIRRTEIRCARCDSTLPGVVNLPLGQGGRRG